MQLELQKIIDQILTFSGDIGEESPIDEFWEKANRIELDGCRFGDKVRIYWDVDGERFSDIGYLTTIPFVLEEEEPEFSGVIHIPNPQNPGGMENANGEWISVYDAISNPLILSIKPIRKRD